MRAGLCRSSTQFRCFTLRASASSSSAAAQQPRVAVVGGGIAGLVAANELQSHGAHVTLFDQGIRAPGGRGCASRLRDGAVTHDHGAACVYQPAATQTEYARARELLQQWLNAGVMAHWNATAGVLDGSTRSFSSQPPPRRSSAASNFFIDALSTAEPHSSVLVATPSALSLAQHLARERPGLTVTVNTRVTELHYSGGGGRGRHPCWHVTSVTASTSTKEAFDAVVIAAAQTARPGSPGHIALSGEVPAAVRDAFTTMAAVPHLPLFTSMARVRSDVQFDFAAVDSDPNIWLLVRDSAKPGRQGQRDGRDAWVVVSSPQFAAEQMAAQASAQASTRSRPSVEEQMASSRALWTHACRLLGVPALPAEDVLEPAQRWSAALPSKPVGVPCLSDPPSGFAACGDWAAGAGVVQAMHSGLSAANSLAKGWL